MKNGRLTDEEHMSSSFYKVSTSCSPPLVSSSILAALTQIFKIKEFSQLGMQFETSCPVGGMLLRNTRDATFKPAIPLVKDFRA